MARTVDHKQQLIVQHTAEMLENSKLAAGIRTRLLELLDRATARQHDRNLELARYRESAKQREHELAKIRAVSNTPEVEQIVEAVLSRKIEEAKKARGI